MVGTLIKTMANQTLYVGMIKDFIIDHNDSFISVGVVWNDNDVTTETFEEREDYETSIYHFHDNGRWWNINENFYKFQRLLEDKCK